MAQENTRIENCTITDNQRATGILCRGRFCEKCKKQRMKDNSQENKHKGMILHNLWLTEAEVESMKISLDFLDKNWAIYNIVEIMKTAQNRGDFIKR